MSRRLRPFLALGAVLAMSATAAAEEARREAGAHRHGAASLGIAIDRGRLDLELDVPAADIAGFEHAPATPQEKAALEAALARLRDAGVFRPATEAQCTLSNAEAALEGDDQKPGITRDPHAGGHADVAAAWSFNCAAVTALTRLDTAAYFATFPKAERIDITIVTVKGQATREATRAAPVVDLAGLQ